MIIASKNPVKIHAVEQAFGNMFEASEMEFAGTSVPSGVSGSARVMTHVVLISRTELTDSGHATVTKPAPVRKQALLAR